MLNYCVDYTVVGHSCTVVSVERGNGTIFVANLTHRYVDERNIILSVIINSLESFGVVSYQ